MKQDPKFKDALAQIRSTKALLSNIIKELQEDEQRLMLVVLEADTITSALLDLKDHIYKIASTSCGKDQLGHDPYDVVVDIGGVDETFTAYVEYDRFDKQFYVVESVRVKRKEV